MKITWSFIYELHNFILPVGFLPSENSDYFPIPGESKMQRCDVAKPTVHGSYHFWWLTIFQGYSSVKQF